MQYQKNEDGTDKLDEQGNPIPVENQEQVIEADEVKNGLVETIKDLRVQLGMAKTLLDAKAEPEVVTPPAPLTDDEKIVAAVEQVLNTRKSSEVQANKTAAFEKFVTDNKEFNPENDQLGFKRQALQNKFNQFNTNELTSVEEFYSVIGDAKILLAGNDNSQTTPTVKIPYSNTPTPQGQPPARINTELTSKEEKLMATTGKTKEQILNLKKKNPDFLNDLLKYVPD